MHRHRSPLPTPPRAALAAGLLALLLAGCTVGPEFVQPTPAAPDDWTAWRSGDASLSVPVGTGASLPADWWRLFGDPVLDRLEQRAFVASPDLRTAALRFAQARAQRVVAGARQGPQVGLSGGVSRQRISENGANSRVLRAIAGDKAEPFIQLVSEPFTLYQAGFDASWELDLWGRVRRSVEAADADVARQAALLLGEHPGALRAELQAPDGDATAAMPDLSAGLPSEVARRRPDIRAAEARLHAATAGIGIARADLYPNIVIGAHFGSETYTPGLFTDWGSRAWSIGPSLSLPLFDQGRRRGVVELRELEQQEAAVAYQRTVLQAWQEIDDALSGYAAETQRERELEARSRSARQAWELARARYDGGVVDYTTVLDTQRSWLQARRELAESQGRLRTSFVAVNKAIGNAPPEDVAVSQRRE